jgi:hypothetical protein
MVLPDSDGISRVPPYSGSTLEGTTFQLQGCYLLWPAFPDRSSTPFLYHSTVECPTTPKGKPFGLGSSRFARRYWGNRFFFLFLRVLRCFSSPGLPSIPYGFRNGYHASLLAWWVSPFGNLRISLLTAPRSISRVRPVLHRLLVPRHSPCALINLIFFRSTISIESLCQLPHSRHYALHVRSGAHSVASLIFPLLVALG